MPICKFCGSYTDRFEWPEEYREYSKPNLCFACYREDPSRGIVLPEVEASTPQIEKPLTIHEEQELDNEQPAEEDDSEDGREDIFPDVDDGCATEDDDNEDNSDDY